MKRKIFVLVMLYATVVFAGSRDEITFEQPLIDSINPSTEIDIYNFNGVVGDKIIIRLTPSGWINCRLELLNPNDSIIVSQDVFDAMNAIEDFVLPATGTYTIRIREVEGNSTFTYTIGLYSRQYALSHADTIHFNVPIIDSIVPHVDINNHLFTGITGDKIIIRLTPSGWINCRMELISPNDSIIASQDVFDAMNAIEDFVLPATGTYTIRIREVEGNSTFIYTIGLYSRQHALSIADTIHFNKAVVDSIVPHVDVNNHLFTSTAGDKIFIRLTPSGWINCRLELINPNDSIIASQDVFDAMNAIEDFVLPAAGTYTIRIREVEGNSTFNYTIGIYSRLDALANADTIQFNAPLVDSIVPHIDINYHLFTGIVGDKIIIRLTPSGWINCRLELLNPNDSIIVSQDVFDAMNAIEDFVLPVTGTYTIRIREVEGNSTFIYTIGMYSRQYALSHADTIHFNAPVVDSIVPHVDINNHLFTGITGDKIIIRLTPSGWINCRLELISPNDSIIASQDIFDAMNAIEDFVLPATGTYTIRIREVEGNSTFIYTIGLYSRQYALYHADTIHFNKEITDSIIPCVDVNFHLFKGDLGDKISIRLTPSGWINCRLELISPNDSIVVSQDVFDAMNAIEDFVLPAKGTYTIRIREVEGNSTFNYTLGLYAMSLIHDASVHSILSPDSVVAPNSTVTPTVIIYNNGKSTETFPMHIRIGTVYYDTSQIISLEPKTRDTVAFKPWLASTIGTYTLVCTTALALDNNFINNAKSKEILVDLSVDIKNMINNLPKYFMLTGNYPNPFQGSTQIRFAVPPGSISGMETLTQKRQVSLKIYDLQGRVVRTLVNGHTQVGYHTVMFDGKTDTGCPMGNGMYFSRMEAEGFRKTEKLTLSR